MPTLETLYNAGQRERLSAAIPLRASCRNYAGEPDIADWAALSYAAERYRLPGARLLLQRVGESLFTGTLLNMGRVTGCTTVAVVIASSGDKLSRIHAGILGESLCLDAVSMGLGCCWISGTYRKKNIQANLAPDEAVLGVIALGKPTNPPSAPPLRRRKSLERLCKGDVSLWPDEARCVAEAVQAAPSAMNMQPWELSLGQDRLMIDASDRAQLDLGIALCHAELTLTSPHTWHFAENRRDPAAWAQLR